jgi:hypothetical protein
MVFTHNPSSLLLIAAAFASNAPFGFGGQHFSRRRAPSDPVAYCPLVACALLKIAHDLILLRSLRGVKVE